MIFYYIRHGDPIYNPDSLTSLGHEQAHAVAKRLAQFGVDRIFASTSNRAQLTAQPTCDLLRREMTLVDFANEGHAWKDFTTLQKSGRTEWIFFDPDYRELFCSREVRALGDRWYEHPELTRFREPYLRYYDAVDSFFTDLGYEHDRYTGRYKVVQHSDERVALFAHQGFSMLFMSCLLDIPYPQYSVHYDMCHSGLTAVNFVERDGWAIPKVMTMSNDSHIYAERLPLHFNREVRF